MKFIGLTPPGITLNLGPPAPQGKTGGAETLFPGMGSNGVTVTKFLQLLIILELYLELSYFLSQIYTVVTVTEVTKVPKFLTWK